MDTNIPLELRFDPATIEDLGFKMYSHLPNALAELVANAYDAAASLVTIDLFDDREKSIIVRDDGEGMSYSDIQDKFLIIGRKQRKGKNNTRINSKNRRITGRKGLGKLALFGIGKVINIRTSKAGEDYETNFTLDWDSMIDTHGVYKPVVSINKKRDRNQHGTQITLKKLIRRSDFNLNEIAISLSKLFNFLDKEFIVKMRKNNDEKSEIVLSRDLRYKNINEQFSWNIHDIIAKLDTDFLYKNELRGKIISSEKPIRPELRGVGLYANGRLVNAPGFFGLSEAGHAYSYLSGWIDADYIDEFQEDLTSTDRQSLNWDMPKAEELRIFLQEIIGYIVKDWSTRRRKIKEDKRNDIAKFNINHWTNTLSDTMKKKVDETISSLDKMENLESNQYNTILNNLHNIIPDYAQYHFRRLHKDVQKVSKKEYEKQDYYGAIFQTCLEYKNKVKDLATRKEPGLKIKSDGTLFFKVFGQSEDKILHVLSNIRRPDGKPFENCTINSLEDAQAQLSTGIYTGFRNPLAHELREDIIVSGLITEQNCLDALSLLSMLFDRLDNAE